MVEEIDRKVKNALSKLADYAPWMFATTVVIFVVLAGLHSSPPRTVASAPDTRMLQYWKTEARLRQQIDRNLEETRDLLTQLWAEMDSENYDADTLLAQIRGKRLELRRLMVELEDVHREIAVAGGSGEKVLQVWDEG